MSSSCGISCMPTFQFYKNTEKVSTAKCCLFTHPQCPLCGLDPHFQRIAYKWNLQVGRARCTTATNSQGKTCLFDLRMNLSHMSKICVELTWVAEPSSCCLLIHSKCKSTVLWSSFVLFFHIECSLTLFCLFQVDEFSGSNAETLKEKIMKHR